MKGRWVLTAAGASIVLLMIAGATDFAVNHVPPTPVRVGGVTVTNALTADDTALADYQTQGPGPDSYSGRQGCYFASEPGGAANGFISCGPSVASQIFEGAWYFYSFSLSPGGGLITKVTSASTAEGNLPVGSQLVDPHGWTGTVGPEQNAIVSSTYASAHSAVGSLTASGVLGLLVAGGMALALPGARRRRFAVSQAQRAETEAAMSRRASFGVVSAWARAAPVVPPSPTLVPYHPPAVPAAPPSAVPIVPVMPARPVVRLAEASGSCDVEPVAEPAPAVWSGPAVLVLGPVVTVGWVKAPDRRVLVELAAFLVTHQERRVTVADLREAVWPANPSRPDVEVKAETVVQQMSRLRRCLGAEHFPDGSGKTGWKLASSVSSDWFRFQALAEAARHAEGDRRSEIRREALALVRGRPFAGVGDGTYSWVWDQMLVSEMEAAIVSLAHSVAEDYLAVGQARLAEWAARRGLLAVPADEQLLADRMTAALADGGPGGLERAWRDARATLGTQATDGPLAGVYEQLRPKPA